MSLIQIDDQQPSTSFKEQRSSIKHEHKDNTGQVSEFAIPLVPPARVDIVKDAVKKNSSKGFSRKKRRKKDNTNDLNRMGSLRILQPIGCSTQKPKSKSHLHNSETENDFHQIPTIMSTCELGSNKSSMSNSLVVDALQLLKNRCPGFEGAFVHFLQSTEYDMLLHELKATTYRLSPDGTMWSEWNAEIVDTPAGILAAARFVFNAHVLEDIKFVEGREMCMRRELLIQNAQDETCDNQENLFCPDSKYNIFHTVEKESRNCMPPFEIPARSEQSNEWYQRARNAYACVRDPHHGLHCPLCPLNSGLIFTTSEFVEHLMKTHQQQQVFVCEGCNEGFTSGRHLQRHMGNCSNLADDRKEFKGYNTVCVLLTCCDCGLHLRLDMKDERSGLKNAANFLRSHNGDMLLPLFVFFTTDEVSNDPVFMKISTSLNQGYPLKIKNNTIEPVRKLRDSSSIHSATFKCAVKNCRSSPSVFASDVEYSYHSLLRNPRFYEWVERRHLMEYHVVDWRNLYLGEFLRRRLLLSTHDNSNIPDVVCTDAKNMLFKSTESDTTPCLSSMQNDSLSMLNDLLQKEHTTNGLEWLTELTLVKVFLNCSSSNTISSEQEEQLVTSLHHGIWLCRRCDMLLATETAVNAHCVVNDHTEKDKRKMDLDEDIQLLYPSNGNSNGRLKCPVLCCARSVCSANALRAHLILEHGTWTNLLGATTVVERSCEEWSNIFDFSEESVKLNRACFLTSAGELDLKALDLEWYPISAVPSEIQFSTEDEMESNSETVFSKESTTQQETQSSTMEADVPVDFAAPMSVMIVDPPVRIRNEVNVRETDSVVVLSNINACPVRQETTSPFVVGSSNFPILIDDDSDCMEIEPTSSSQNAGVWEILDDDLALCEPLSTERAAQDKFCQKVIKRTAKHKCSLCNRLFLTANACDAHYEEVHKNWTDEPQEEFGVPLDQSAHGWFCPICVVWREDKDNHETHLIKLHGNNHGNTPCLQCCGYVMLPEQLVYSPQSENHAKHHHDNRLEYLCTHCPEPYPYFQKEDELLCHVHIVHGAVIVGYCRACMMCSTNLTLIFRHVAQCSLRKERTPALPSLEVISFVAGSEVRYFPKSEKDHMQLVEENKSKYLAISNCTHRSLLRSGPCTLTTCPESDPLCFGLTNSFRLMNEYARKHNNGEYTPYEKLPRTLSKEKNSLLAYVQFIMNGPRNPDQPQRPPPLKKRPKKSKKSHSLNSALSNRKSEDISTHFPYDPNNRFALARQVHSQPIMTFFFHNVLTEQRQTMLMQKAMYMHDMSLREDLEFKKVFSCLLCDRDFACDEDVYRQVHLKKEGISYLFHVLNNVTMEATRKKITKKDITKMMNFSVKLGFNALMVCRHHFAVARTNSELRIFLRPVALTVSEWLGDRNNNNLFVDVTYLFQHTTKPSLLELFPQTRIPWTMEYERLKGRVTTQALQGEDPQVEAMWVHVPVNRRGDASLHSTNTIVTASPASCNQQNVLVSSTATTHEHGSPPMQVRAKMSPVGRRSTTPVRGQNAGPAAGPSPGSSQPSTSTNGNTNYATSTSIQLDQGTRSSAPIAYTAGQRAERVYPGPHFSPPNTTQNSCNQMNRISQPTDFRPTRPLAAADVGHVRRINQLGAGPDSRSMAAIGPQAVPAAQMMRPPIGFAQFRPSNVPPAGQVLISPAEQQHVLMSHQMIQHQNGHPAQPEQSSCQYVMTTNSGFVASCQEGTSAVSCRFRPVLPPEQMQPRNMSYTASQVPQMNGAIATGMGMHPPHQQNTGNPQLQPNAGMQVVIGQPTVQMFKTVVPARISPEAFELQHGIPRPVPPEDLDKVVTCVIGCSQVLCRYTVMVYSLGLRRRWFQSLMNNLIPGQKLARSISDTFLGPNPINICIRHFSPRTVDFRMGCLVMKAPEPIIFVSWYQVAARMLSQQIGNAMPNIYSMITPTASVDPSRLGPAWSHIQETLKCSGLKCTRAHEIDTLCQLRLHGSHSWPSSGFLCNMCEENGFPSEKAAINHIMSAHPVDKRDMTYHLECPVNECSMKLATPILLRNHIKNEHWELFPHGSDHCLTHFSSPGLRCFHDKYTHEEESVEKCCELCGLKDWTEDGLSHKMIHGLVRQLICRSCLRPVTGWNELVQHMHGNCRERCCPDPQSTDVVLFKKHVVKQHGIVYMSHRVGEQKMVGNVGREYVDLIGCPQPGRYTFL